MLETIRRYWIGFLVLALVLLHASIVGIIRYQASLAKKDISCEVLLGEFVAYRTKDDPPVEMTLHAIVPLKQRMKSRQLIELNEAQVRQALEEHLRQFDGQHLADPYMTDLRSQLLDILSQLLGSTSVEDILITRIRPSGSNREGLEFVSNSPRPERRRLVATLREDEITEKGDDQDAGAVEHGTEVEGDPAGHSDASTHPPSTKEPASHPKSPKEKAHKPAAKTNSHGSKAAKH
jgi:hypothetical protein